MKIYLYEKNVFTDRYTCDYDERTRPAAGYPAPKGQCMGSNLVRHGYAPKFRLADHLPISAVCNDRSTVHNYAFEVGYMLLPRLSLGLGVGYERYWLRTGGASDNLPLYVHGSWFLGRQSARGWFAYARAGSLLPLDSTLENGFTGGAGIGYRLNPCRRFGIDFKAGYDCSAARVQPIHWAGATSESDNWSRHSLSLGIGLLF